MSISLNGPLLVFGAACKKKLREAGLFFTGFGKGMNRAFQRGKKTFGKRRLASFPGNTQIRSASGRYRGCSALDMAENYIFSIARPYEGRTGFNWVLLPLNCARTAWFGVLALLAGWRDRLWVLNENDNKAVPMQPEWFFALPGGQPRFIGTSAVEYEPYRSTTNLNEPTST